MKKWFLFWYERNDEVISLIMVVIIAICASLAIAYNNFLAIISVILFSVVFAFLDSYIYMKIKKERKRFK